MSGAAMQPLRHWGMKFIMRKSYKRPVQPIKQWNIVQGDMVYIRSGKDAGTTGRVLEVLRKSNRVLIEGRNLVRKHVRARRGQMNATVGIISRPSPIHYSNVNLLDPTLNKPTRISIRYDATTGEKVRLSKRSGAVIPYPEQKLKYRKPVRPAQPGLKDTSADAVATVTYTPPAELLPYLSVSSTTSLFAPSSPKSKYDISKVPEVLRNEKLRKKDRNRIYNRWKRAYNRVKYAEALNEALNKVFTEMNAKEQAAENSSASSSSSPQQPQEQQQQLR